MKRARTYRARADGCGAVAGRIATTGRAPRDDRSAAHDDGYAALDDGSALPDDGSAARNDGWHRATTGRQLATTGMQRLTTGTGSSDDGCCSCDDGGDCVTTAEIARRRVAGWATTGPTPCGRVTAIVYKGGRLDRDSRSD